MFSVEETVYKLNEFSVSNEASKDSRYNNTAESLQELIDSLRIQAMEVAEDGMEMEFDLVGVGAPIANAIRRILIAEVPSMAIDKVHIYNNTSVIPDEVLAHRLGLVPIKVDPRLFVCKAPEDEEGSEEDTLRFELKVKCTRKPNAPKDVQIPDEKYFNHAKVKSSDLKFLPLGNQQEMYGNIRPVHEDILLDVLKPGHEIDLAAFCFKNIGREHAKFSPVVIASYRLLPQIRLLEEISGERAHTLAKCFPKDVVRISQKEGKEVATVGDARNIHCSRNVYLYEELKDAVEIVKVKDHYIFTVESIGALPSETLVTEAINVLKEKCRCFISELKSLKI